MSNSAISVPVLGGKMLFGSTKNVAGMGTDYDLELSWKIVAESDTNQNGLLEITEANEGFMIPLRLELPRDHPGFGTHVSNPNGFYKKIDKNQDDALSKEE